VLDPSQVFDPHESYDDHSTAPEEALTARTQEQVIRQTRRYA
jgi:hypothetical protein